MKKFLLAGLVSLFAFPLFTMAQVATTATATTTDQFTQTMPIQSCVDLKYNMGYRSRDAHTNGEVSDLQDFLIAGGYLSGEPSGYFGMVTRDAVKKFQLALGIGSPTTPGYGGVGPKSRANIKDMTCGGNTSSTTTKTTTSIQAVVPPSIVIPTVVGATPSITILSPSSGDRIEAGKDYGVRWTTSNFPANTPITITLLDEAGTFTKNNVAMDTANDGYEIWRVPATLSAGNYRIRVFCTYGSCVSVNNQSVVEGKSAPFIIVATPVTATSTQSTTPTVTSFTVEDSTTRMGYKRFAWATSDALSVDFIVDCVPGLTVSTMMLTSPFRCGVTQSGITPLEMFLKFTNITTTPITTTAAIRAVGSTGYNSASKVVYITIPAATLAIAKTDLELFNGCVYQSSTSTPTCAKADFNKDGFVNIADLAEMKSALKYDLNGDNVIDLTDSTTNADLSFIKGCFYQPTTSTPSCTKADFNGDGLVNTADLAAFKSAVKYDLDGDLKVTYGAVATPVITSVKVLSPNGGEAFNAGGNMTVTWRGESDASIIDVSVFPWAAKTDTTRAWTTVASTRTQQNTKSATLTLPASLATGQYFVRLICMSSCVPNPSSAFSDSAAPFTITNTAPASAPTVTITANPTSILSGTVTSIVWNSVNATSCFGFDGPYSQWWGSKGLSGGVVTPVLATSTKYTLSCSGAGGTTSNSVTVGVIPVSTTVARAITITSPNGGEVLPVGSVQTIKWSSSNIDMVSIGWSTGPGSLNWIATNIPNTGSYAWTVNVGNTTNTQFKISVIGYQTGVGSVTDDSDNYFTIPAPTPVIASAPVYQQTQLASVSGAFDTSSNTNTSVVPQVPSFTYNWSRNLQVGSPYVSDISALQAVLIKQGIFTGEISGSFYSKTFAGVKQFQQKYGIDATGFVGPTTRAKLNELYR